MAMIRPGSDGRVLLYMNLSLRIGAANTITDPIGVERTRVETKHAVCTVSSRMSASVVNVEGGWLRLESARPPILVPSHVTFVGVCSIKLTGVMLKSLVLALVKTTHNAGINPSPC